MLLFYQILEKIFHVFFKKFLCHHQYSLPPPIQKLVHHKNKFCTTTDNKVLWSELDENLLGEILSKLISPTCQARFHAVSKTWRSVRPIMNTSKPLPWFVGINSSVPTFGNTLECHLYEPSLSPNWSNCTTSLHKISLSKLGIPCSWTNVKASLKNNWFYISLRKTIFGFPTWRTYFLLFSPCTRKIITLPKLDYWFEPSWYDQTFSTNPDCPDCVFLVLDTFNAHHIVVMTCCHGDKEWTVRKFARMNNFARRCVCSPVYIRGIFYIVSPFGQLASYNIISGELKFESLAVDIDFSEMYNMQRRHRVFKLNGELMIMYFGIGRMNVNHFPSIPCIKRFDWFTKAWIPLTSLGDQTLFVGDMIQSIMKVDETKARQNGVLSNTIYYLCDLGCIIYSFKNGVLVQFKYHPGLKYWGTTNYLTNSVESGDVIDFHYNSGITYQDLRKTFHWFEPPVIL